MKNNFTHNPSLEIKSAIDSAQLAWTKVAATEENSSDEEPVNGDNTGNNGGNTPDPEDNVLG